MISFNYKRGGDLCAEYQSLQSYIGTYKKEKEHKATVKNVSTRLV